MSHRNDHLVDIGSDDEGATGGSRRDDRKIRELDAHVQEVTNVMTENINKILERGQRLDHLEERSDLLTSHADEFQINSRRVSWKYWWQNTKWTLIIALIVIAIVVIIIVSVTNP